MYSFQITTVTRLAASVQIRISQLSTKHTTNYTTISSVLRQKLHRILTDSLVNSNSRNPNRRNTPSFWKKTSQLKFVNCDQQSPGNLLFKLQAKLLFFQRLEDHYDNVPRVLITEQEALEEFKRKHPDSKNLQFPPLPTGIVMQGQMEPITEDEIKTIILRIKKAKSPGEDGITGQHLKYLVYQHETFLKILEFFFNQLLNNPRHLQDCKQLFRFRALLIPKKTGGFRPVSCESMILAVFSSCLKTRLMQQIKIHDHQFCFKSGGITHALARVESFKAQGKTLTLADCTNAYQAIDHNAIMHALQLQGVNSLFVEYYRAYLNTRSCKYADKITSGCPAGSSTSSQIQIK
ncbi:Reverse_transcriptase (RNA-dependent DNA polymerase) [Hexamita inflata]|uniref:Reverse transcriptase (RNA-dependent DNA polymerase) n=1 Tax=Hexamita inflata TaxID=28002 RepID=A0AA86P4J1_9EUKA|nr:Reverse transcriptase (RNA-dependent DNA polymerase) [Hexamita inflata]